MTTVFKGCVNQTVVEIRKGSITAEKVDAIVNAANNKLQHYAGVAGAICKAGGPTIQEESDDLIKKNNGRPVKDGQVAVTSAGNLPCAAVVHAVGPIWVNGKMNEPKTLASCVVNSLRECEKRKLKSIAFPAISCGIFGYPKDMCAKTMLATLHDYLEDNENTIVKRVHMSIMEDDTLSCFSVQAKRIFAASGNYPVPPKPVQQTTTTTTTTTTTSSSSQPKHSHQPTSSSTPSKPTAGISYLVADIGQIASKLAQGDNRLVIHCVASKGKWQSKGTMGVISKAYGTEPEKRYTDEVPELGSVQFVNVSPPTSLGVLRVCNVVGQRAGSYKLDYDALDGAFQKIVTYAKKEFQGESSDNETPTLHIAKIPPSVPELHWHTVHKKIVKHFVENGYKVVVYTRDPEDMRIYNVASNQKPPTAASHSTSTGTKRPPEDTSSHNPPPAKKQQTSENTGSSPKAKFCTECGNKLTGKFCSECGTKAANW